jgi:hypothetical protein
MGYKDSICGFDIEKECPKRMLNGPCGGVEDKRCEVDQRACVWIRIYAKLKSEKNLDDFIKVRVPNVR